MPNGTYEAEYLQGIEHFNAREFFEAHEVWEDIWARTTGRHQLFYKGLIHAAVALHHFGNRNVRGRAAPASNAILVNGLQQLYL